VVERSRTHVGNLAHALKTPLTVLTNEARSDDTSLGEIVRRQSAAMSEQVEHHLQRARAAARARAIGARTPIAPVLADLTRTLKRIHPSVRIDMMNAPDEALVFRGELQDLTEMIGNIMDNACKWAASVVRVSAGLIEPGLVFIQIEDDGPGLDEAEREKVLARGVRLDERTPGSGLGLAIVDDLARAYGGTLKLGEAPGGGLSARIELPVARPVKETTR